MYEQVHLAPWTVKTLRGCNYHTLSYGKQNFIVISSFVLYGFNWEGLDCMDEHRAERLNWSFHLEKSCVQTGMCGSLQCFSDRQRELWCSSLQSFFCLTPDITVSKNLQKHFCFLWNKKICFWHIWPLYNYEPIEIPPTINSHNSVVHKS